MKATELSELEIERSLDRSPLDAFGNPWAQVTDDIQSDGSIIRHIDTAEDLIIPAEINLASE